MFYIFVRKLAAAPFFCRRILAAVLAFLALKSYSFFFLSIICYKLERTSPSASSLVSSFTQSSARSTNFMGLNFWRLSVYNFSTREKRESIYYDFGWLLIMALRILSIIVF